VKNLPGASVGTDAAVVICNRGVNGIIIVLRKAKKPVLALAKK